MIFSAKGGLHASFFPMDPVTIYLQRLKDRPIRVFTGFLDETPYYELYPGTIEFSASCTLKKLLYTYFDPALPYTRDFLNEFGWVPGADGSIYNPQAINGVESDKDGGMGALLFATMQYIGHWDKANIKIEALPADLITRMSNMLRTFEEDSKEAQKELEVLISRFVGAGDYGNSGSPSDGNVDVSGYDGEVPEVIFQVGRAMNAGTKLMLSAFMTGLVESDMKNLNYGDRDSKGWRQERTSIYGSGPDGPTNVNASAKRYFSEGLSIMAGKTPGKAGTGMYQESWTAGRLAQAIQGSAYPDRYDAVRTKAAALMEKVAAKVDGKDTSASDPATPDDTPITIRGDKSSKTLPSNISEAKLSQGIDVHGALPGLQPIAQLASIFGLQVTAGKDDHTTNVAGTNRASDHSWGGAIDVSNGTAPTPEMDAFNALVKKDLAGMIKQLIWRDKDQFKGYDISGHMNHVHVAIKEEFAKNKEKSLAAILNGIQGKTITAAGSIPLGKKSVIYVGDSLSVGTYPYLKKSLGEGVIVFDGVVGRNSQDTMTKLTNIITGLGETKMKKVKTLIFDAGTNDDFSHPEQYQTILDSIHTIAKEWNISNVVIFTLNRGNAPGNQVNGMNDVVREKAKEWNFTVVDWASKKILLGPDGVHPTGDGYKTRSDMTKTAVAPTTTSSSDVSSDTSSTDSAIMSRANATVLAATMQWSSIEEQIEAVALQGNKSLMNDKPLLPFIQQMAESSLRQFQSMPNGDFFAFYPDYFGETWHRPPYWLIDDIEVLEGRVKLNDAALVTHEYAIGNTYGPFTSNPLQNKLMSAGVVSITNAFQADLVQTDADRTANGGNNADKDTQKLYHAFNRILKQDEAVQFLERYGARPDVQDFPFIRNPFFELFMAYQRFMQAWSRQFLSPFKLTFMPELYPGGKVGFPEHGLQMYIEEVTHSWDYTSGFVTEADLSSPAAMLDKKGNPLNDNLPSNRPTALIEVATNNTGAPGSPGSGDPNSGVVVADDGHGQMRPT